MGDAYGAGQGRAGRGEGGDVVMWWKGRESRRVHTVQYKYIRSTPSCAALDSWRCMMRRRVLPSWRPRVAKTKKILLSLLPPPHSAPLPWRAMSLSAVVPQDRRRAELFAALATPTPVCRLYRALPHRDRDHVAAWLSTASYLRMQALSAGFPLGPFGHRSPIDF